MMALDKWSYCAEAKTIDDAKELATVAASRLNLTMADWEPSGASITPWAYARVMLGEDVVMMVGASSGGVVSVEGKSHTPQEHLVNVTLARVEESMAARLAVMKPVFEHLAIGNQLRAAIPDAEKTPAAVFRDGLETLCLALSAKGVSADVIGSALSVALEVYGNSVVAQCDQHAGYVLAFPGASEAEAEELFDTLRAGGNPVVRVRGDVAQAALEAAISVDFEAENLQP